MKQFTTQQLILLRNRAVQQPQVIEHLRAQNAVVLNSPVQVPKTAIATWNLYYFCPVHGVRLVWDRACSTHHRCPVDGQQFSGEPYDGAWWREMNGLNARACHQLGLLWQLTGEAQYLDKVTAILTAYAAFYPNYQIHGNIPHNGPGKMNAQTLCEANCLLEFALGFDYIAEALTAQQRDDIQSRLLRCGAEFLLAHRTPQLHNHEVKIGSAIGVLGFILQDESLLEFAVNQPYGLRYQLEHGLFEEGLWFEGSIHYHFYALQGFLAFEKLAKGSRWSLLDAPFYRKMLSFPLQLLMPDGNFPRLNDCIYGQEKLDHSDIYEFAWSCYRDEAYAAALQAMYRATPRSNIDALLYGTDLPAQPLQLLPQQHLHAPSCGITIWRNPAKRRALLVKHTPYGGEHDHYDRLSLILFNHGKEILPDLGTTGYGAQMHYAYYKNSATHNTLAVNQANQPPAIPQVLHYHENKAFCWLDTEVDWRQPPPVLDSHTRVEWDNQAYRDVRFRRRLLWLEDALIDISSIENPHQQQLDWTLHLPGKALDATGDTATFSQNGPLSVMHDARVTPLLNSQPRHFAVSREGQALWLSGHAMLWQGSAPANPAVTDLSYLTLRSHQTQAEFVCVWDFNHKQPITKMRVKRDNSGLRMQMWRSDLTLVVDVNDDPSQLPQLCAR
ncbi:MULTISPECIES: heparinase II/III family protein [unclassified Serratia (in: enterobacteria)]|uniref:heparinase II/III domain-containing protein n=1 Tax=unclassified Serratia (in: enterobacteria) TaxID=2647522 RepID=UPI000506D29B|nr:MULTISPECIES: heparinase II/III family protein [unclassified Serratia (in: enterobacteria)]KFK96405.1 alginate lyase [Serratia sp. Ag2]KFK99880.1 alginate lyase [Serratia sp. Ag1]